MATEEGWVGIEEVAAHLRVAKQSIYRWVESKSFPAHRVGRPLRFKLSEVDEWVTTSLEIQEDRRSWASGGSHSRAASSGKASKGRLTSRKSNAKKKRDV